MRLRKRMQRRLRIFVRLNSSLASSCAAYLLGKNLFIGQAVVIMNEIAPTKVCRRDV